MVYTYTKSTLLCTLAYTKSTLCDFRWCVTISDLCYYEMCSIVIICPNTVYIEIFEWQNFWKKWAVSNFENSSFENGARV